MKTPGPTKAEPSAPNSANSTAEANKTVAFTPRQSRVMDALLQTDGWISRESVDRIAGASNGPQIILELRRKVTGHDGIEMLKSDATDRDGKTCKPGRYRLTSTGRQRALKAMSTAAEVA
ncbi:hypothetical protein [Caenimonas soli]|uniref:hypothetical protein n=1 Tax=Caenimonas soli TaxID=2735555 RepID=UPI001553953A|nr:hypothetical protein [Caenimonas soli]NPC57852.1 hypothetical protein [Caenimonas soli]